MIRAVHILPIEEIWKKYSNVAMIERKEFLKYYFGIENGFVIEIEDPKLLEVPIPIDQMRSKYKINPPQSYIFMDRKNSEIIG